MLRKLKLKLGGAQRPEANGTPVFLNERLIPLLANTIFDWQIVNGVLLKYRDGESIKVKPVSVSLVPTAFPKHIFERAKGLQKAYNELYAKVSSNEEWLLDALEDVAKEDDFVRALLEIYKKVREDGFVQDLTLGIFRSDYMLHQQTCTKESPEITLTIKQVEFNTMSVAGGCHATYAAEMHAYMARTGAFQQYDPNIGSLSLPLNPTIESLVSALASAHAVYGPPKSLQTKETAVLMIIQPLNYNIADERPLEYALWNSSPAVPTYRCILRSEVMAHTSLTETRELLYHPPFREGLLPIEISVVYLRAGYDAGEYDTQGKATRLHLERSRAIKCPDILGQLAGCKIVQQALSRPGVLKTFVRNDETRKSIENSFGKMWPLDSTELGKQGRAIALNFENAIKYVLKPNREGGGHNIYRNAIPPFLKSIPESTWSTYILMELFDPPKQEGKLMTTSGIYNGDVVSELGIFGTCLWRRGGEVLENSGAAGWSFKTKPADVDEMSVVKGYGCFDCPRLVDG